jgi:hypothetical protein
LFRRIELARHQLGLAIFQVVALQELDQGRAGVAEPANTFSATSSVTGSSQLTSPSVFRLSSNALRR